jgi:hypothetical protein
MYSKYKACFFTSKIAILALGVVFEMHLVPLFTVIIFLRFYIKYRFKRLCPRTNLIGKSDLMYNIFRLVLLA